MLTQINPPKRQPLPTMSDILAYWGKNQDDLYTKTGYLLDRGEPTCWACNDTFEGRFDQGNTRRARWENSPLQRCHIVPDSLGGSNDPSNFVLMCRTCHDLSPDTTSPEILFAWMRSQSKLWRIVDSLSKAFSDFGANLSEMNESDMARLWQIARSAEFRAWSKGKLGLHWAQTDALDTAISPASLVGALLEYANHYLF